jgi:hypothetical protein
MDLLGIYLYRAAENTVNIKLSLILTGLLIFQPATRFAERYGSVVSCDLKKISFRTILLKSSE